jgi:uncharacterized protein YbcI
MHAVRQGHTDEPRVPIHGRTPRESERRVRRVDVEAPMMNSEAENAIGAGRETTERGHTLAALSDAIVSLHKRFYGKGPEKARTHLHRNLAVVLLSGGFTRGEQTLNERGQVSEVLHWRLAMQSSIEAELQAAVERILNRRVRSAMSASDPANDVQAHIFVLLPIDAESANGGVPSDAFDADAGPVETGLAARAHRVRERNRELVDEHRALRSEQEQSLKALRHHHDQDA